MTWLLRPGAGIARRDADHLQLGIDPPLVAVLPDTRGVRLLLVELAHGGPLSTLDDITVPALDSLVRSRLVVPSDEEETRAALRSRCLVHVDAPDGVLTAAVRLVGEAGLGTTQEAAAATMVLVWCDGELARNRLDGWVRDGTTHLVVSHGLAGPRVGPFVVPGATACMRCVDAHAGEADPRRSLVVEQLAATEPLRPRRPDPALRALALAWAVRDLATAAEGGVPATWSAAVDLSALPPVVTTFRRHLHCGCAWADSLALPREAAWAG